MNKNENNIGIGVFIVLVVVALVGFAVMASYQQWTLNHGIETPSPTLPPITPSPPPLSINDLNFTLTMSY